MSPFAKRREIGLVAIAFFAPWLAFLVRAYGAGNRYLMRDNFRDMFPVFRYVSGFLHHWGSLPTWYYSPQGGVWFEPLTNSYLVLAPYRWLGYLLAASKLVGPNGAYKISLLFGLVLFLVSLFLVGQLLFRSRAYALLLTIVCSLNSLALVPLHQECDLALLFPLPTVWYLGCRAKADSRFLPLLASVLGLGLNVYYPQITFVYWLVVLLSFLVAGRERLRLRLERCPTILAGLCGLVTASPLLFSFVRYRHLLSASSRGQASLFSASYAEYLRMARLQWASLYPPNLLAYLEFGGRPTHFVKMGFLDETILFVVPGLAFFLFLNLWVRFRLQRFQLALTGLLALCAIGIYGPVPRLLWYVVPGIRMFRQWYHILPYLDLHLTVLVLMTAQAFVQGTLSRGVCLVGGTLFLALGAFGVLSPWNAFGPVCLLAYKALPKARNEVTFLAMGVWLVAGSLAWAIPAHRVYRAHLPVAPPAGLPSERQIVSGEIATPTVAEPRGERPRRSRGSLSPLVVFACGPRGAFCATFAHRFNPAEFSQFDDGNWRISPFGTWSVSVARAPSPWPALVIAAALVVLLSGLVCVA